jgi:sugar (pentulose or hexulose) kinase
LSTRANISDAYIVVLDAAADALRALLFDSGARRVEGYAAQLPRRADAAEDCLDEMHRLVQEAGFHIGAVVGPAEDRSYWPAFHGASWFPALPEGAGVMLGSGCVGREQVALVVGDASLVGTLVESRVSVEGLACVQIGEKRWMLSGAVPEAGLAYSSFKHSIKGSVEKYLENATEGDPLLAGLDAAGLRFREVYQTLAAHGPAPLQVIGCGLAMMKAPALAQRIADAVGVPLTLSTEQEPGSRGAALWALERIGAIDELATLPASMGRVFEAKPVAFGVTAPAGCGSIGRKLRNES